VDSRQSVASNRLVTPAVQRSTIYTHVYLCVSVPRLGRGTESVSAFERTGARCSSPRCNPRSLRTRTSGTQSVLLAVVRVRKPTVCPRTTLGRVVRLDLFHGDTLFRGFVRDILKQASERPDVVPFSLRKPSRMSFKSSNAITSQSCSMASETSSFAIVWMYCFRHASSRFPRRAESLVCGLRPTVLHLTTPLLELTTPVVVVVSLPERPG